MADRPSFLNRIVAGLRSLAVLAVGFNRSPWGLTGIATGGKAQHVSLPIVLRLLVGVWWRSAWDIVMFTLAYRWLTKRTLSFREVLPGSVFAGLLIRPSCS